MAGILKFLFARRASTSAATPSAPGQAVPGDEAAAPSALLKDVLAAGGAPGQEPRSAPEAALSQRLNVGSYLAAALRETAEAAAELGASAGPQTATLLASLIDELSGSASCIAFVGQMNAGKSTLINVLVEQADLLPADINPWTTVVTQLHFGVPGAPASGATFTFFDRDEWQRLSSGGRVREITERLFPDFDWQALRSQVEAMQERARRKLGTRFEELLGTEHDYPTLTPGLLNRYVGAGLDHAEVRPGMEGEFSDITKSAKVYFDLGAFSFPTILIDTPGVNDPFLVRDEITRQSLESADICVVVLTARQPLSTTDLSLLRLLRGLNKSRLIVFVNKIDEIEGGAAVLHEVSDRVAAIIKDEFPEMDVPVVLGSALWARKALSGFSAPEGGSESTSRGDPAFLLGLPSHEELSRTLEADAYFRRSGLSDLAVAVSRFMAAGPIAEKIVNVSELMSAICRNSLLCCEAEREALSAADDLNPAQGRGWTELAEAANALLGKFATTLDQFAALRISELSDALSGVVAEYSGENVQAAGEGDFLKQLDLTLRLQLERTFLAEWGRIADGLDAELKGFDREMRQVFAGSPFDGRWVSESPVPALARPALAALGEPVAIEATELALGRTLASLPAEAKLDYLRRLFAADFTEITARLTEAARQTMQSAIASVVATAQAQTLRPLEALQQRLEAALARLASAPEEREQAMAELEERIARLTRAFELTQRTNSLLQPET